MPTRRRLKRKFREVKTLRNPLGVWVFPSGAVAYPWGGDWYRAFCFPIGLNTVVLTPPHTAAA